MASSEVQPVTATRDRANRLVRRGGVLLLLGFLAYGAMFISFGITDTDPFEVLGGAGWVLAGVGAWLIANGIAARWAA